MLDFITQFWAPITIGFIVFLLFIWFLLSYCMPAINILKNIQRLLSLDVFKKLNSYDAVQKKDALDGFFDEEKSFNPTMYHAWQMYSKTLHPHMKSIDGEMQTVNLRSTAPSDLFFSHSLLVDNPLNVEFFKHIAGIMTGIGIIGTFGGLLMGLSKFDPTGDPANVQNSLALLLHGVRDAFIASGIAIFLAMLTIAIEKYILKKCYIQLEKFNTSVDSLFEADEVGEEYLEKLVKSSEENANHSKWIKDSLVGEFKTLMTNLMSEQQKNQQELAHQMIEISTKNAHDMANQVGQSIADALQDPLAKIAGSVQKVSDDQGTAVQDLMTDALTMFIERLESTFGNQMNGMSDMMNESVHAMRDMQRGFSQLITDMRHNSEASTDGLEKHMVSMLAEIQHKQNEMGNAMTDLMTQVRDNVAQIGDKGTEVTERMNAVVVDILDQMNHSMSGMMANIGQKRLEQDRLVLENQHTLHQATTGVVNESVHVMREMQSGFNQLVSDMRHNSVASTEDLEKHMVSMLAEIQHKQNEMGNAMTDLMTSFRNNVAQIGDKGTETTEKMSSIVAEMLDKANDSMFGMITNISQKRIEQDLLFTENNKKIQQITTSAVHELTAQISRLLEESRLAIQSHRQNIDTLNQVSMNSIHGMSEGAEKIRLAADRFNESGQSLSTVTKESGELLSQINTISNTLNKTTSQLHMLIDNYQESKNSVDQAIQTLESVVLAAQKEAGMSSEMLIDMQKMTQALGSVRQDMEDYLEQINEVLVKVFDSFGDAVESSLNKSLGSFDNTLDQAVSRLASGIESLGDVTDELAEMSQRNLRRN